MSLRMALPLVTKELAEQAVRPGTFALRVVFALLLYLPTLSILYASQTPRAASDLAMTGLGVLVFESTVVSLLVATFLVLPMIAATSIAEEKERGCLELLVLTRLSAWQLVRQKYISRLIPMLTLLLTAMPLFAVAYAYGGTSPSQLLTIAFTTSLTMMLVAAIALFCSAWCNTTVNAILASYVFGPVCYVLAPAIFLLLIRPHASINLLLFTPYRLLHVNHNWTDLAATSIGLLAASQFFLALARQELERRLLLPEQQSRKSWVRRFDTRLDQPLGPHGVPLPPTPDKSIINGNPVAWRETARRGLRRPRHVALLVLAASAPVLLLAPVLLSTITGPVDETPYWTFIRTVWFVCEAILLFQASTIIASERNNQTWDILLSTPLSAEHIVRGKLKALRLLQCILAIPMLTVLAPFCPGIGMASFAPFQAGQFALAVLGSLLALEFILWIGFTSGMLFHSRKKAMAVAAVVTFMVFTGTRALAEWVSDMTFHGGPAVNRGPALYFLMESVRTLSPLSILQMSFDVEHLKRFFGRPGMWILWLAFILGSLHCMRRFCLGNASGTLRGEQQD